MNNQQISAIINMLRLKNEISPLEKDILDTWNELHKVPFDADSARRQIASNNISYPDIFVAINAMPGVVYKFAETLTREDIEFTLCRQLDGLVAKEMERCENGKDII